MLFIALWLALPLALALILRPRLDLAAIATALAPVLVTAGMSIATLLGLMTPPVMGLNYFWSLSLIYLGIAAAMSLARLGVASPARGAIPLVFLFWHASLTASFYPAAHVLGRQGFATASPALFLIDWFCAQITFVGFWLLVLLHVVVLLQTLLRKRRPT